MKKISLLIMGASILLAPFFSAEAVTVVESSSTQQLAEEAIVRSNNAVNAELFNRLQSLQEEVMRTRGLLEEQQQQLQELKQQRLEDYKNLDKRLTELDQRSSKSSTTNSPSVSSPVGPVSAVVSDEHQSVEYSDAQSESVKSPDVQTSSPESIAKAVDVANQQDSLDYQKSYDLIKQRKFEQARDSFTKFIAKYPDSEYQPNAYYWLGELYIIDGNFVKAKSAFQTILKKYPDHTKYPEALYKIATVNYELGDRTTAKLQMEQLINQYGDKQVNAVSKAREFLKTNFP